TLDNIFDLYATDWAEGDSSGYDSLLMFRRTLMAKNLLELIPLLQQPSVQQLIIAYWQCSANDFAFDGQLTEMGQQFAKILT
ncbi:hypothetical protein ODY75_20360, partial [Shewanella xiamenensis]|nr:hypothetical protein [Shewanella xiamenensis]